MFARLARGLAPLLVCFSVAGCNWSWMEQEVTFADGTRLTLQHRSTGTFRTVVSNRHGDLVDELTGAADSRHVSLYRSPTERLIIADYGVMPLMVELSQKRRPSRANAEEQRREHAAASKWRYLGAIRRTDQSRLEYFPDEPECQDFGSGYGNTIVRRVVPCRDSNYVGL
jgi:hypothetical protein